MDVLAFFFLRRAIIYVLQSDFLVLNVKKHKPLILAAAEEESPVYTLMLPR